MEVITGKTSHGFEFAIEASKLDSYELVKRLRASEDDITEIVDIIPLLFGPEGEANLMKALGDNPSFTGMVAEVKEAFGIIKEHQTGKKSSSLPN